MQLVPKLILLLPIFVGVQAKDECDGTKYVDAVSYNELKCCPKTEDFIRFSELTKGPLGVCCPRGEVPTTDYFKCCPPANGLDEKKHCVTCEGGPSRSYVVGDGWHDCCPPEQDLMVFNSQTRYGTCCPSGEYYSNDGDFGAYCPVGKYYDGGPVGMCCPVGTIFIDGKCKSFKEEL